MRSDQQLNVATATNESGQSACLPDTVSATGLGLEALGTL